MSGVSGADGWGKACRSHARVCNAGCAHRVWNLAHIYLNVSFISWEEVILKERDAGGHVAF